MFNLIELFSEGKKKKKDIPIPISFEEKNEYLNYRRDLLIFQIFLVFIISIWFVACLFTGSFFFKIFGLITSLFFFLKQALFFRKWRKFFQNGFENEFLILELILKQKLSSETVFFQQTEDDGRVLHVQVVKSITAELEKLENLEKPLSALFGYPLLEKKIKEQVVDYYFELKPLKRLVFDVNQDPQFADDLKIDLGYGQVYDMVKNPHILVSGGTGSGKSVFISWLILELMKRHTDLYVVDPKHSDLSSLAAYLHDHVAVTLPQIAKVTRLVVEEMQKRYDVMNDLKNFKYGANFQDHGFKPVWLLFDEMGAFQALGSDKESKAIVQEIMNNVKKVVLLGRQAGVFLLISAQQMSVNTLGGNSEIRDQLGLRIALGSNSSDGYRMTFGSHTPDVIPDVTEKGSGLLYMDGEGKSQAQYWESPFVDMKKFDFLNEFGKYYVASKYGFDK